MKRIILITMLLILAVAGTDAQAQTKFDDCFENKTLRIDIHRTGSKAYEKASVCRLSLQGDQWAGTRSHLLDPVNNGDYRVLILDQKTGLVVFSRNYNSLFREFKDTPEGMSPSNEEVFEEVVLAPLPKNPFTVFLQKRDSHQEFYTVGSYQVKDPSTIAPNTEARNYKRRTLLSNGDPKEKLDLVIVAEGYSSSKADRKKMKRDMNLLVESIFKEEPFKSRKNDFNVWGVEAVSEMSGISNPLRNQYLRTAVRSQFNVLGLDRYLMTYALFALYDAVGNTPCDQIVIMNNTEEYGGGAIYNFYATVSMTSMAPMVLLHELGHSIGGLADEYEDNSVTYNSMHLSLMEPLEPNITSLVDFDSKWKNLLPEGTPVPTPKVATVGRNPGPLGVYEGAGYLSKGLYRPTPGCMMRDYCHFCPVCAATLEKMFNYYCNKDIQK